MTTTTEDAAAELSETIDALTARVYRTRVHGDQDSAVTFAEVAIRLDKLMLTAPPDIASRMRDLRDQCRQFLDEMRPEARPRWRRPRWLQVAGCFPVRARST